MHVGAVWWSLLTLLGAVDSPLGSPLRVGPYSIRPPAAFRLIRMEAYSGTRAGAVSASPGDARALEAALVDGPSGSDAGAASMLISIVEGGFSAVPSGRDDLAAAALRHFSEELGLKLSLERADLVASGSPRVEVLGSVRQPGQVRRVLVAALEGTQRHAVVIFSLPSGRYEELRPVMRASLDSFRRESGGPAPLFSQTTLTFAAALLLTALVALSFRKKAPRSS